MSIFYYNCTLRCIFTINSLSFSEQPSLFYSFIILNSARNLEIETFSFIKKTIYSNQKESSNKETKSADIGSGMDAYANFANDFTYEEEVDDK